MHNNCKYFLLCTVLFYFNFRAHAQADCVLGVGISDEATITDVFQLNKSQREQLANLGAEQRYRSEVLNIQLKNIAERHPQSNLVELQQLSEKYRTVMDSMAAIQVMIDKKLLSTFNQKQYDRYLVLCKEAGRSPHIVVPTVYDSVPEN